MEKKQDARLCVLWCVFGGFDLFCFRSVLYLSLLVETDCTYLVCTESKGRKHVSHLFLVFHFKYWSVTYPSLALILSL